jgi:hypothetical protein
MVRKKRVAKDSARVAEADVISNEERHDTRTASRRSSDSRWPPLEWILNHAKKADFILSGSFAAWNETRNPVFAWMAIDACSRGNIEFPEWVRLYLGDCAQRMLSPDAEEASDVRKVLPSIMGFSLRRGPGNPLKPFGNDWQYTDAAITFMGGIAKGAKPAAALRSAFDGLDSTAADKMDEKTLQSHIKKFFEVSRAPRTNAGWRQVILAWAIKAFGPLVKEFRETRS